MDSSSNTSSSNYQEPLSSFLNLPQPPPPPRPPPTSSLFDPLPSYLPTFGSSAELPSSSSSSVQPPAAPPPPRTNPKKRSRASRRAPTTVLTTDTSNFRAMVQEFTGFPAPPFSASSSSPSPFPRPRSLHLPSPSSYLSTPFAHNNIPPTTPSSLVDAIAGTSANINTSNYPFVNPGMIGVHNPPILPPQFGDLGSLVASEAMQHLQVDGSRAAGVGLSRWADGQEFGESSSRDQDDESSIPREFQQEKRQKTLQAARNRDGVVESWIHPSD